MLEMKLNSIVIAVANISIVIAVANIHANKQSCSFYKHYT